jgi:hypothetical protein
MLPPRTKLNRRPTGLAFNVADLLVLRAWSDFHELRMTIDLDIVTDTEEYEEIVNILDAGADYRRWMLWRSADGIVVQPRLGRPMLFDAVADALELLIPAAD